MKPNDFFIIVAKETDNSSHFRDIVLAASDGALNKKIKIKNPLDGEVFLGTSFSKFDELYKQSLDRVIGILVTDCHVIEREMISTSYVSFFVMAAQKVILKSEMCRRYGISLAVYTQICLDQQAHLLATTERFAEAEKVAAHVAIVDCPEALEAHFKSLLRRVVAYSAWVEGGMPS